MLPGELQKKLLNQEPEPWPEPEPIRQALAPVEPLPAGILPEPYRPWITDISHRMQCPVDFIAVAAMIKTGAIIGAGCGIRPKRLDDWLVIPNLWGGVIGRPGALKTPALNEALKPLARIEALAKEKFEEEAGIYEAEREAFKARKEALKGEMVQAAKGKSKGRDIDELKAAFTALEAPEAPVWKRYKTNDSTIEMMAELLSRNPRGILLFRDELTGLLTSWEKEGREPDRAFFLEAWNGYGSHTTDRIGRGTVHVDNLCISILGGIQPAKLTGYLKQATDALKNDGLLQRFQLMVYPDDQQNWKYIDEYPNHEAKENVFRIIESLAGMDFIAAGAEPDRVPYFNFTNDAQKLFVEWLTELEARLLQADDAPVIKEHLGKYRSLMPSLALVNHLINITDGSSPGPVTLEAAEKAAAWCDYLEGHARRIYGMIGNSGAEAAELAKKVEAGKLLDGFTIRDIYRQGWHLLSEKEAAEKAAEELTEAGWLRAVYKPIEGRQGMTTYSMNPKIFS